MNNDLISRAALLKKLRRQPIFEKTDADKRMLYVEKSIIEAEPTVDAVPVVRCVDCVYRHNKHKCPIAFAGLRVIPAWYCAWGAKEDRGVGDIL